MPATARIVSLLVVVVALPFLPGTWIVFPFLILLLVAAFAPPALRAGMKTAVWRIRWLLLAIVVLFLFFSPGPWSPDHLWTAVSRAGVLLCAVGAVQLALYGLTPAAMADGLSRVLSPFRFTGLPTERFAQRLTLTLDAVPRVQELMSAVPASTSDSRVQRLADRAAAVVAAIEREED